jgi:hypothetical protein
MRETTVTLLRANSTLTTGMLVQIDQVTDREMVELSQVYDFRGVDVYRFYTLGYWSNTLVKRADILLDEHFTDEETGAAFRYRVVSRPQNFALQYQMFLADVVVGT